MEKEQFEELLMNIIQIGNDIKERLDNIHDKLDNNSSDNKMLTENEEEDLYGIPLNSAHHPRNPDYTSNKNYYWNKEQKMWRKK